MELHARIRILLVLVLASVLLAASPATGVELSEFGNPFIWVSVGQVRVKAEKVDTPAKLFRGLGQRDELPEGRGMLFVMPEVTLQHFCMRDMRFAIDIIWIAGGKVAGLEKNVSPQYPGILSSPQPVNFVLEVPGGFAEKYGIRSGDPVSW